MLEKYENPWDNLDAAASGHISSRRVWAEYPYDFYFAKDSAGKYMLVFSLSQPVVRHKKILLNGITVSIVPVGDSPSIVLLLKDSTDWPIFLKICIDLCDVVSESPTEEKAVGLFYNRLLYWQYFLKRDGEDKLSKEEQIGLIGELLFLEKYILPEYNAMDSINFWTGADADVQDFFIGGKRIEAKTCSSPSKNEVHISSLQQLYDAECPVYLVVVYIGASASDSQDSFSLFSLANRIAAKLREIDVPACEAFVKKLANSGMFLDGTYNDAFYIANQFKGYRAQGDFPKITPTDVKDGITKVKYIVNLGYCKNYEVPLGEIFKKE